MTAEYRFGRFVLRPALRRLFADGEPVPIGGRALDLLTVLVEQHERAVTRDELIARVWPGRVVADENLKVQVLALRKLLGPHAVVTVPRVGYRFGLELRPADTAPAAAPGGARLWGREADVAALHDALGSHPLVTVVGPGGIGKTRVAHAVAARCRAAFDDGVYVVDLATVDDPADVPTAVARALELAGDASSFAAEAIGGALRRLSLLVVLDNCEHLRSAVAALVHAMSSASPRLRVLATSQEPLGLFGERVVRLAPLPLPHERDALDPAHALRHAAVALFVERAQQASPGFALDAGNVEPVVEICRRLDGVPLAIELAAARVPLLGVAGVRERLDKPLQLLSARAPGAAARHPSLRDSIAWSVALLAAAEQALFRRVGVFVGSFSLDAAQAVAADVGDEWAVLGHVAALADKSLLQLVDAGPYKRYRLLESARAFALEQLDAAGESELARRRHAEAMLACFDRADAAFFGAPLLEWADALMPELGNLRAALAWSRGPHGDRSIAVALAAVGSTFCIAAGLDAEAARNLSAVRAWIEAAPPRRQAQFWLAWANRAIDANVDADEPFAAAGRALELFRRCGDAVGTYRSLAVYIQNGQRLRAPLDVDALVDEMRRLEGRDWTVLQRRGRRWVIARQLSRAGDWQGYSERFRAEVKALDDAGDASRAWTAAHAVALAEVALGRPHEAVKVMAPAVAAIRARGLGRRCWAQVAMLALAQIEAGDDAAAARAVQDVLPLLRAAGSLWWLADHLAGWVARQGAVHDAARLQGWADARYADRVEPRSAAGRAMRVRTLERIAAALGNDDAAALRDAGARLLDDEAADVVQHHAERAAGR